MIRHMFPGNNTPDGFFSYFENINPFHESKKTIYIKGGSGTGKSTFMKKMGRAFEDRQMDVEYFHCSNDPDSLDAVCIPKLKIAVMDATSPHILDPLAPVAVDEILNVAVCLKENNLSAHAEELKGILAKKKGYIEKAYRYLNAGYSVYLNNSVIYNKALDYGKLNMTIYDCINTLFVNSVSPKPGKNRRLFASAITPIGFVNYLDNLFKQGELYVLNGNDGCGMEFFLQKMQEEANIRGLDTEGFYSPLNPNDLEHLIIPQLNLYFTTSNKYHKNMSQTCKEINFQDFCNQSLIEAHQEELQYNMELFDELMNKTMSMLRESKKIHNDIEEIYISSMDFEQLDKMYDQTLERLLQVI